MTRRRDDDPSNAHVLIKLGEVDEKHDIAHARLRKTSDLLHADIEKVKSDQNAAALEFAKLPEHIRIIVHEELAAARSFRKNGDGWRGWFGRVVTPERIAWAVITIYILGGKANKLQGDLTEALQRGARVTAQNAELLARVDANQKALDVAVSTLSARDADAMTKEEFAAQLAALKDQLRTNMTRGEFQSFVNQTIAPRLDRIERQHQQFLDRNGESRQ